MSEINIKRITTDDTKKTYEWVDRQAQGTEPQLCRLEVKILSHSGGGNFYSKDYADLYLHVELSSIQATGRLRPSTNKQPVSDTLEDLVLRCLDIVGVRPNE